MRPYLRTCKIIFLESEGKKPSKALSPPPTPPSLVLHRKISQSVPLYTVLYTVIANLLGGFAVAVADFGAVVRGGLNAIYTVYSRVE